MEEGAGAGAGGGGDRAEVEKGAGLRYDSEDVLGSDRPRQRMTHASSKADISQVKMESGKPLCLFC